MFTVIEKGTGNSYTVYGVSRLDQHLLKPHFLIYGYDNSSSWEWVSADKFFPE